MKFEITRASNGFLLDIEDVGIYVFESAPSLNIFVLEYLKENLENNYEQQEFRLEGQSI